MYRESGSSLVSIAKKEVQKEASEKKKDKGHDQGISQGTIEQEFRYYR
jgi:hypothetical protein